MLNPEFYDDVLFDDDEQDTRSIMQPGYARIPMDIYTCYSLSGTAREVYGLLLSRRMLSQSNPKWPWAAFVCYAQCDLALTLGVSEVSVRRAMKELEDVDLIRRRRRGSGKPDLIRVLDPEPTHRL